MLANTLHYVHSCDVDEAVFVRVAVLEGQLPSVSNVDDVARMQQCACMHYLRPDEAPPSLHVNVQLHSDGRRIGVPVQTRHQDWQSNKCRWNQWLPLPIKYSELSRDAHLTLDVCDYHDDGVEHVLAGTAIACFSKWHMYRHGVYDLHMHPFASGDLATTPAKMAIAPSAVDANDVYDVERTDEESIRHFAKLGKKHRSGQMEKVDWLDRQAFREIGRLNEACQRRTKQLFLMIEFATVTNGDEHRIIYYERNGDLLLSTPLRTNIIHFVDHELGMENLVESKHTILTRTSRSEATDRQLKPNAVIRDELENILQIPCCRVMTSDQRDLVWKYRYYLQSNNRALVMFLQSVNWHIGTQVAQALTMMTAWTPMDVVDDALQLLSIDFKHVAVRRYAVHRLASATDAELRLYLLQLVQALKFDHASASGGSIDGGRGSVSSVPTAEEADEATMTAGDDEVTQETTTTASDTSAESDVWWADMPDLATMLIERAAQQPHLANYLYWYLQVERESYSTTVGGATTDERLGYRALYTHVLRQLSKTLSARSAAAKSNRSELLAQQAFVNRLVQLMQAIVKEGGSRTHKINYLKSQLSAQPSSPTTPPPASSSRWSTIDMSALHKVVLPVEPSVRLLSAVPERATLFNSARMPARLTFVTTDGAHVTTIFKHGDDLRQDQLIMQLIELMDRLLRADNLDLRLTTYKVLATGVDHGFVQFIDSYPLRDVLKDHEGSILKFLQFYRPSTSDAMGVECEVMDNYVRSTAGYSVMSYILGLGDRHLHNLLIQKNGRMFHIDFGYILGRDPKPMPPPMKLTEAMVEGMGGTSSAKYGEFRGLCITTFLQLRRHANLVLNLFQLMTHANIADIALEPETAVEKIHERFHLDLSDEEAERYMHELLDASVSAKMAVVNDLVHDWAQKLRS